MILGNYFKRILMKGRHLYTKVGTYLNVICQKFIIKLILFSNLTVHFIALGDKFLQYFLARITVNNGTN